MRYFNQSLCGAGINDWRVMDRFSHLNNMRSWNLITEQIILLFSQTHCRLIILLSEPAPKELLIWKVSILTLVLIMLTSKLSSHSSKSSLLDPIPILNPMQSQIKIQVQLVGTGVTLKSHRLPYHLAPTPILWLQPITPIIFTGSNTISPGSHP